MLLPLEYHFPENSLSAKELDDLLAKGYFRTGNFMMCTKVLYFNEEILNTLHIRIVLEQHFFSKSLRKMFSKNNQLFTYKIQPFSITVEKELLYKDHRKRFKGNASHSLTSFMYDSHNTTIFNTYEINIYDKDKLVGFSFFDIGITSMASIIGIFDQNYSTFSLGIYTMLLEIEYAKAMQLRYYYTGYITYEPSQFNYKLRLSKNFEFYNWFTKKWDLLQEKDKTEKINDFLISKTDNVKEWLNLFKLPFKQLFYPQYYMGSMYPQSDCVKSIHHLLIEDFDLEGIYYIIEFNPIRMELILSGITIHKHQFEEKIDFSTVFNDKGWTRVLLYLHPQVVINNEFELYAGYIYLQELFKTYLNSTVFPNAKLKN